MKWWALGSGVGGLEEILGRQRLSLGVGPTTTNASRQEATGENLCGRCRQAC